MMKKNDLMFRMTAVVFNVVALSALFTIPVYAYIDPSALTYVIQAVAGVVIALGALVTVFRHKIAGFFRKGRKEETKKEIHFNEETEKAEEKNND